MSDQLDEVEVIEHAQPTEEPIGDALVQNSEQADETEMLIDDRESLELLVVSILTNKRLAWKIVSAYLNEKDYVMAPREWLERKLGPSSVDCATM